MKKEIILNRKNQKIMVLIEENSNKRGLVFVMHGLGGHKEEPHIQKIAEAFKENDYTVIRFDTTNALGESDGKCENATIASYCEDLEDVIFWAKSQNWYQEPFCLAGHSLGSMAVVFYAEKYPEKVKGLAPISTVISGRLDLENYGKEEIEEWKNTGWREKESRSRKGVIKRIPWSFVENLLNYDILKEADKLTMPVLLIVGENDRATPLKHQKIFYDKLLSKKELHIIKNARHTFRGEDYNKSLKELKDIFDNWIKNKL